MRAENRVGYQTVEYKNKPLIVASACAVGPREGQGPLGEKFDLVAQSSEFGQESYEQAEAALLRPPPFLCRSSLRSPRPRPVPWRRARSSI